MKETWRNLKRWYERMRTPKGQITREEMLEGVQSFRGQIADQRAELAKMLQRSGKMSEKLEVQEEIFQKWDKLQDESLNLDRSDPEFRQKFLALNKEIEKLKQQLKELT